MDIPDDGDDPGQHVDDDVPVYEPMYPEHRYTCSHPDCDNDCGAGTRICEDCTVIMRSHTPDTCTHCGAQMQTDRNT